MLPTTLKSFDTNVIIGTTSSSITLSLTVIVLIVIPTLTDKACGLTISNEVFYEIIMQKYKVYKNNMRKINKFLNLSIICTEKVYKIIYLIKMNMNLYVNFF